MAHDEGSLIQIQIGIDAGDVTIRELELTSDRRCFTRGSVISAGDGESYEDY